MPKNQEIILDECINYLRSGKSIDFCLSKYPRTRGLRQQLEMAQMAMAIPKKEAAIDSAAVWNKIKNRIHETKEEVARMIDRPHQLGMLRFAFSRSMMAIVMAAVIISALDSTAVAAQNSMPGETLYPIKRTVEKIQLSMAVNDVTKTEVRLKHAEARLTEAKAMVEKNTPADGQAIDKEKAKVIESTINELVDTTNKAAGESTTNKELLKKVVELTDKQEQVLATMEPKVSDETKKVITDALGAAVETKTTATKNLAELENPQNQSGTAAGNATSTGDQIQGTSPNTTSTEGTLPKKGQSTDDRQATSTDGSLQKFGEPTATSSDLLIPPPNNGGMEAQTSTTTEIIELK